MPKTEDILPEEDELMDRCQEFVTLITHRYLKPERDALFHFIVITSLQRARQELDSSGYTRYPTLEWVVPIEVLDREENLSTGEQELFVNKVLEALKAKKAISMSGPRYA